MYNESMVQDVHLMLMPSLACPAGCLYCFGPRQGGESISQASLEKFIHWLHVSADEQDIEITFHGGEPLSVGAEFYRQALPRLTYDFAPCRIHFAIQSNLWLLTDELCDLFAEYHVSIGTSLDGPKNINDAQRGIGNFRRTFAGIELARRCGLSVGCICTFTSQSSLSLNQIIAFFIHEGLEMSLHPALPALNSSVSTNLALSPQAYADLLINVLNIYLENLNKLYIPTLDAFCQGVAAGEGGLCFLGDCLGKYLTLAPDGYIYPCQRFAGMPAYRLSSILDPSGREGLVSSPVWQSMALWRSEVLAACENCDCLGICRGGCLYNAIVASSGCLQRNSRDPYCVAYQRLFHHIIDIGIKDFFSRENLTEIVNSVEPAGDILRVGKIIGLMRYGNQAYHQGYRHILM